MEIPFKDNEESASNINESISMLESLEQMQLKLEHLEGVTQVCANAFNTSGALGNVSEKDLENSFLAIREQVKALEGDTQKAITAILEQKARLNY